MAEQATTAKFQRPADRVVDGVIYRWVEGDLWKPIGTVLERQAGEAATLLGRIAAARADVQALTAQEAALDAELAAGPQNEVAADNAAQQYRSTRDELAVTNERIAQKQATLAARRG